MQQPKTDRRLYLGLLAQLSKYQFDFATLFKSGYTELSIKGGHSCGVAA